MFQQSNVYQQSNPYAQQNMYQYNTDTYLRYNMYPFEPHYGNQNYYQPFEVSFMNQPQQPYMNQQPQPYINSQYYMPPPSPMAINKRCFIHQNNRIRHKINKSNSSNQVNFLVLFPNLKIQMVTMM